ncbi:hypothetical protein ABT174_07250 [Streptomyces sparsogenes]
MRKPWAAAALHEATALWDVRTAEKSDRDVKPVEPVRSLLRGGRGDPDAWRLVPRDPPLPRTYLAGIAAAVGAFVLLPYGEELLRCVRTAGRGKKDRRKNNKNNTSNISNISNTDDTDPKGRETPCRSPSSSRPRASSR